MGAAAASDQPPTRDESIDDLQPGWANVVRT
jgi:hypothetical protein